MAPFEQKRPSKVEQRATNLVFFIPLDNFETKNWTLLIDFEI